MIQSHGHSEEKDNSLGAREGPKKGTMDATTPSLLQKDELC